MISTISHRSWQQSEEHRERFFRAAKKVRADAAAQRMIDQFKEQVEIINQEVTLTRIGAEMPQGTRAAKVDHALLEAQRSLRFLIEFGARAPDFSGKEGGKVNGRRYHHWKGLKIYRPESDSLEEAMLKGLTLEYDPSGPNPEWNLLCLKDSDQLFINLRYMIKMVHRPESLVFLVKILLEIEGRIETTFSNPDATIQSNSTNQWKDFDYLR